MSDTPIADMVDQMMGEGVSRATIVLAVRTAEQRDARVRERAPNVRSQSMTPGAIRMRDKRMKDKINQELAEANDAATRAGKRGEQAAHDGAQRAETVQTSCDLSSSLSSKGTSEEERKKESKKEVIARARGTRLSADAAISDADREFARSQGMSDAWIDRAWAEYVDYWIGVPGQRGTKLNWSATWRNRVRQISTKGKADENNKSVHAAVARLHERIGKLNEPAPSGLRGGEGGSFIRLLSKG